MEINKKHFINDISGFSKDILSRFKAHSHHIIGGVYYHFEKLAPAINISTEIRPLSRRFDKNKSSYDMVTLDNVGIGISERYALRLIAIFVVKHNERLIKEQIKEMQQIIKKTKGGVL